MALLRLYGRAGAARGIGVKNPSHQTLLWTWLYTGIRNYFIDKTRIYPELRLFCVELHISMLLHT